MVDDRKVDRTSPEALCAGVRRSHLLGKDPWMIGQLGMTNIAMEHLPKINGGFVRWENHLFRLGPSIPWRTASHNQKVLSPGWWFGAFVPYVGNNHPN